MRGAYCFTWKHTQASLRAKLDKEEKDKTNASKNDDGKVDVQGVELQEAAPKPSGGCCSML